MQRIFYRHNAGAHEFYLEALGQIPPEGAIECPAEAYEALFAADPVLWRFAGPGADGLPFLEATGVVRPTPEQLVAVEERAWRDAELLRATAVRDRHRDQQELGIATAITDSQFVELLTYMQSLRDWPQSPAFPVASGRPAAPVWLSATA